MKTFGVAAADAATICVDPELAVELLRLEHDAAGQRSARALARLGHERRTPRIHLHRDAIEPQERTLSVRILGVLGVPVLEHPDLDTPDNPGDGVLDLSRRPPMQQLERLPVALPFVGHGAQTGPRQEVTADLLAIGGIHGLSDPGGAPWGSRPGTARTPRSGGAR